MPKQPRLSLPSRPTTPQPEQAKPESAAAKPPRDQRDQRDLIRVSGLPAVQALFANRGRDVERLFYEERFCTEVGGFCKFLAARRKPYRMVPTDELTKIAGTPLHGGIVAVARPAPALAFDPAKAVEWAKEGKPLLLLDGVGNPHNLGAILRSMAFFGLDHLLISHHPKQAAVSEATQRVAEGGVDWVTVHRAPFPETLALLAQAGYRVVGTALENAAPIALMPRDKPLAIIMGNEEDGLPAATIAACANVVKLPGSGRVQSLNVSATAAILLWEMVKGG